ncbi:hypothetical protein A4V55_004431 [Escherichia coli]|nr:DUF6404 family protein [Escherichia coli]EFM8819673.1 hypothetical protein [Escherichia coli]
MTFEQKKARAIALMDSKKIWRSNYAPPLLRILWRLGIRLPPLPFMPFWQVTLLMGSLWGISWGCAMWFIYWRPSGMVAGEAIIISITGGFLFIDRNLNPQKIKKTPKNGCLFNTACVP